MATKKAKSITVKAECAACGASGIYRGFAEKPGTGVVCLDCHGTGAVDVTYVPFTRRKTLRGVKTVYWSRGSFVGTGVGAMGVGISYEQFLKGKLPPSRG